VTGMDLYVLRFSCARRGSFVQRLKESRVFVSGRVRTYVASGGLAGLLWKVDDMY
jgi:hypothetical protein